MSLPYPCAPVSCCPTEAEIVEVPGIEGSPGAAGTNGAAGVSSYTVTTSDFVVPAIGANVTVSVGSSLWMVGAQNIFIEGPANFQVISLPGPGSAILKFLGYTGDVSPGATISAGAGVAVGGLQGVPPSSPLAIASGGTAATTKAAAQTNLGLGQNSIISTGTGLTQAITASANTQIGSIAVTIPALGEYLLLATARLSFTGVTFAASRTVTLKIRNVTQGTDIATATYKTGVATTQDFPNAGVSVPFVQYGAAAVNDVLQLTISVDVVNTAGTFSVVEASLAAIPLRKS